MMAVDNDKKQNILIVHNYYQTPGGEDTVVANEKRMLEDHGHKVILYSRDNSEIKHRSKIRKLLLPITTIFNPRTYREIKSLIKSEKIEIVHVHNTLNLISPAVYYAALKCKIPVVQTVHNFRLLCPGATFYRDGHICEDCVEHGLRCSVKHSCYRDSKLQTLVCVINTKIHRMTGIYGKINYICLTEFNKEKLLQLKQIKTDRVFLKPNFSFLNPIKNCTQKYYLFIGRIETIKGIDVLLKAFCQMPDKELIVAGTGTKLEVSEKLLEANGISNITLVGFQSRGDIDKLLSNAKALIVPSQWYETFGMVIVESFSSGIPVIVGNIGNIGDLVEEYRTGIHFEYDSSDSLIEAVNRFESVHDIDWRKNTLNEYHSKYSPERNYEMLKTVYDKLGQSLPLSEMSGGISS